jgi:hypothetical protein
MQKEIRVLGGSITTGKRDRNGVIEVLEPMGTCGAVQAQNLGE